MDQSRLNDAGLAADLQTPGEASFGGEFDGAGQGRSALEAEILDALKVVRDPEIPVNLVDLGLIYGVHINHAGVVRVEMTLTTPACPVAGSLPGQVQNVVSLVPGVAAVIVDLVWEPAWTRDRMTMEARLELGLM